MRTWTLVAVTLSTIVFAGAAQVADSAPRSGLAFGMIVGQVVDGAGAPVGEAIVTLGSPGLPPDGPGGRVMADSEGRFLFTELPAGEYYVQATKDGYIRGSFGQRLPWGQGQLLPLAEGERRTDVELRVWNDAVIGGRVVDEAGEPVVGITVRALQRSIAAGRMRFGSMEAVSDLVPPAVTDDRGMFRLSQVTPGTYVVVVPSTHTTLPASALRNPDYTLRTELFWGGIGEMTALGTPRAVQMGSSH